MEEFYAKEFSAIMMKCVPMIGSISLSLKTKNTKGKSRKIYIAGEFRHGGKNVQANSGKNFDSRKNAVDEYETQANPGAPLVPLK